MARNDAVWGIDVGQCALKALRCRPHDDGDKVVADAFDYIEYPKILSQAGADPAELVADALKQFLSRNSVRGDRVAISVPGQSGLARFIKLPPVEAKKIPDIVRYEARQQIPFDLNDVIWDYQRLGGGSEEEGFALETEIGLFAMKRDAVFRTLEPFQKAGIEVDFVQLTPLALYNFMLFDQLTDLPPADEYDPESPPKSIVILSLGTDATDLVVTNGFRVWQRSIPLGGNHFTKALTKELKLTFAKAEHLKRNATAAQDPKAVFQAMRPVFSDLLTEVQRSVGYFTSIDRGAEIDRVVGLGNAMKLPGLRRYLAQSLGYEVVRLDEFRGLVGSQVLTAPAFKDNSLCFGVCYGLALQGLGRSGLRTNLLPKEIVQDRMVRQKKPWAVAAAAAVLLACGISFGIASRALSKVDQGKQIAGTTWQQAESKAEQTDSMARQLRNGQTEAEGNLETTSNIGQNLVGNVENRILWLELLKAVNVCLPPPGPPPEDPYDNPKRDALYVTSLECQQVEDLAKWYRAIRADYHPLREVEEEEEEPADEADQAATPENADATVEDGSQVVEIPQAPEQGAAGSGWVIIMDGYHFHNLTEQRPNIGAEYVRNTLIKNLQQAQAILPNADRELEPVWMEQLGICYPVLVRPKAWETETLENNNTDPPEEVSMTRFDFTVHFCWHPASPSMRQEKQEGEEETEPAEEP